MYRRWRYYYGIGTLAIIFALVGLVAPAAAQGTLSQQVLALLSRVNTWIGQNTFQDLRIPLGVIPSDTAARIYTDLSGNLYYNGGLIAGAGGGVTPHNLLSTTHADTLAGSPTRGAVIVGNSTPRWSALAVCAAGSYIGTDGTDTGCQTSAAGFTAIPAGQITGTASAFVGTAITALNASNLTSGTVPLTQLAGITDTQIGAGAAIAYSKLALSGSIVSGDILDGTLVNADINASAGIVYSKLFLTGSVVFGDWASNGCTNGQIPQYNGAAWVCATAATGNGTVTSVGLTTPAIFTAAGSPVTGSGTLTFSVANESANLVWAGPTTGAAAAATFRGLVNADLPLSGVGAGTYAKVTVNTAGVVTAATAKASLTADVSGILPMANGGTGVGVSGDDSVLIGSGSAWVAQTLPDCPSGALAYTQATNLFSCGSGVTAHNLLSATHGDTLAAAVVRGDLVVGNSTPKWGRLAIGTAGKFLTSNGTDASWSNTASLVTNASADLTLSTTTSGNVILSPAGDIKWGKALVTLGGGSAPTLGTIGGSGPATAAQNSWMRVLDSTGAAFWVPVWK